MTLKFLINLGLGMLFMLGTACSNADEKITVLEPQVMLAPPGISVTAGLMTLRNNTDEDIVIKSIEAENFERVELHKTEITDGTARMIEQKNLKIPAKGTLELAHGGYHLMLYGPDRAFAEGDLVSLTLQTSSGTIEFDAPVKRLSL